MIAAMKPRSITITGMIFLAALTRLFPHPPNATPLAAMALFGAAMIDNKRVAFAIPFAAMLLSDAIIGFHATAPYVYASFLLIGCIGLALRGRRSAAGVIAASLASSVLFFVLTNIGVWLSGGIYPRTAAGLFESFTLAIPFFRNTLAGDLFYSALLFGSWHWAERRFPALRPSLQNA
jgi:hypothetical protein